MVAASPAVNLATPNNRKKTTRLYLATAWPAGKLHFCKVETMNILLGGWRTLRPISREEAGCYRRLWRKRLRAQESGPIGAPTPAAARCSDWLCQRVHEHGGEASNLHSTRGQVEKRAAVRIRD